MLQKNKFNPFKFVVRSYKKCTKIAYVKRVIRNLNTDHALSRILSFAHQFTTEKGQANGLNSSNG